jgi:hypothetical protein
VWRRGVVGAPSRHHNTCNAAHACLTLSLALSLCHTATRPSTRARDTHTHTHTHTGTLICTSCTACSQTAGLGGRCGREAVSEAIHGHESPAVPWLGGSAFLSRQRPSASCLGAWCCALEGSRQPRPHAPQAAARWWHVTRPSHQHSVVCHTATPPLDLIHRLTTWSTCPAWQTLVPSPSLSASESHTGARGCAAACLRGGVAAERAVARWRWRSCSFTCSMCMCLHQHACPP